MNHKRKRSRTSSTRDSYDARRIAKKHPALADYLWMRSWPEWWDIVFHRRPHRREAQQLVHAVKMDRVDCESVAWPVSKKPHSYFW